MKLLIAATFLVLYSVYSTALQPLSNVGRDVNGQRQQMPAGNRQIRQCACSQQNQCFREWKQNIHQCSDQCRSKMSGLNQVVRDQSKLYPCLDLGTSMFEQYLDCINSQFTQAQTCAPNVNGPMVPFQSSTQLISTNLRPLVEDLHTWLRSIDKTQHANSNVLLDAGECVRDCMFSTIQSSPCFERINCELRTSGNQLEQVAQQCFRQMDFKNNALQVCNCVVKAGVNDLEPFCQNLRNSRVPQSPADLH